MILKSTLVPLLTLFAFLLDGAVSGSHFLDSLDFHLRLIDDLLYLLHLHLLDLLYLLDLLDHLLHLLLLLHNHLLGGFRLDRWSGHLSHSHN